MLWLPILFANFHRAHPGVKKAKCKVKGPPFIKVGTMGTSPGAGEHPAAGASAAAAAAAAAAVAAAAAAGAAAAAAAAAAAVRVTSGLPRAAGM